MERERYKYRDRLRKTEEKQDRIYMYIDRYKFRETEGERPCKREMEGE